MNAAGRLAGARVALRGPLRGLTVLALVLVAGCPPDVGAQRTGFTPCAVDRECNPSGAQCGPLARCVAGYCSTTPVLVVCGDAAAASDASGPGGECLSYGDCNPPEACGLVVSCVNFRCDREGPRLEIPCFEAGAPTDASGGG